MLIKDRNSKMSGKINKCQAQSLLHCFLFDPSIYISMVAVIKGEITAEEIKSAVEKAYTMNETTMSKIILENGNAYFQNMPQTGCKVFVDERDWREIMHESEKDTFRINEGELFRIYIIPKPSTQEYTIFMMAHHIAGDGKSLIMMMEDILKILSGEEVEYRPLNKEGSITQPTDLKLLWGIRTFIQYLNRMWKKQEKVFDWDDYFHVHQQFWKDRKSNIRYEIVEKENLEEIKRNSKEMGITVNSYMITEFLKNHPEYKNFSLPISLKGENRSISNQVILLKLDYAYNTKKSFGENAQQVHRLIKQHVEDDNKKYFISSIIRQIDSTLMDACLMYSHTEYKNKVAEIIANLTGYHGNRKTDIAVTNLTNIPIQADYERFHVENIFGIAACMSAVKKVICIGSYEGRMTISYSNIANENKE